LKDFASLIMKFQEAQPRYQLPEFLSLVLEKSGYLKELTATGTDEDQTRIENLQELVNVANEFEPEETDDTFYDDDEPLCGGPEDSLTNQEFSDSPKIDSNIQTPIYTIFYTATQNGELKNGEYYSHITDKEEAKNDCVLQLGNIGYSDVQIKAMEQTTQTVVSDENTPKP
jgi:superfamily I DNA/RNA helicase